MIIPSRTFLCAVLALAACPAAATNIVQNPGFEQGSLGWDSSHFSFVSNPLWAHTGNRGARLTYCSVNATCLDEVFSGAYVGQVLDTTPGELYNLSFWVRSFTGDARISVFWDGMELLKAPTPNGPMIQYTFSNLSASAGATLLEVHGYNETNKYLSLDDFSVLQVVAPPPATPGPGPGPGVAIVEPGVLGLMMAALGALLLSRRPPFLPTPSESDRRMRSDPEVAL